MTVRPRTIRVALPAIIGLAALAACTDADPRQLVAPPVSRRTSASASSPGAVYAMTNEASGNRIMVFNRGADGLLTPGGTFATGGMGSGAFENSSDGLVLSGQSPDNLNGSQKWLYATNTGSSSLSVLKVTNNGLEVTDVEPSGGARPISLTVHANVLYVLNQGSGTSCTGSVAVLPSISGFRVSPKGQLTPIPGSTRPVSGGPNSGCAQISFTKDGSVLVVTERAADVISTYLVGKDGAITAGPIVNQTTGNGPFGFSFTQRGQLVTTENVQGAPGQGGAASYDVSRDGTLTPLGPTVRNGRNDTCWIVITDNNKFAYATNFQSNDISIFGVNSDGTLVLINPSAATLGGPEGAADQAFSNNSHYLYARNVVQGTIHVFAIDQQTGSIAPIQVVAGLPPGSAIGIAAR